MSKEAQQMLLETSVCAENPGCQVYYSTQDTIAFAGHPSKQPVYEYGLVSSRCLELRVTFDVTKPHETRPLPEEELDLEDINDLVCPRSFFARGHEQTTTLKVERLSDAKRFGYFVNACRIGTLLRTRGVLKATPHIGAFHFGMFMTAEHTAKVLGVSRQQVSPDDTYGLQCQETAGCLSLHKHLQLWIKLLLRKHKKQVEEELCESRDKFKVFMRDIIFQVLFSLDQTQQKCPGIRHNDLHPENVVLKQVRGKPTDYEYRVGSNQKKFLLHVNAKSYLASLVDWQHMTPTTVTRRYLSRKMWHLTRILMYIGSAMVSWVFCRYCQLTVCPAPY